MSKVKIKLPKIVGAEHREEIRGYDESGFTSTKVGVVAALKFPDFTQDEVARLCGGEGDNMFYIDRLLENKEEEYTISFDESNREVEIKVDLENGFKVIDRVYYVFSNRFNVKGYDEIEFEIDLSSARCVRDVEYLLAKEISFCVNLVCPEDKNKCWISWL